MRCAVDSFAHGAAVRGEAVVDAGLSIPRRSSIRTQGQAMASRTIRMPRSPAPSMPSRMRSLALSTLPGAAATARPDAIFPRKLRRESIWG